MKPKLSMTAKLVLINLAYIIPCVFLIAMMANVYQGNIDFAAAETKGIRYQEKLEPIFRLIGEHSWLAQRALYGDAAARGETARVEAAIEKGLTELEQVDAQLGVDLKFTDGELAMRQREHFRVQTLRKEWTELQAGWASLKPEESIEKHSHLVADIRAMIVHLGDTSNIILDPDLDSYYLGDALLGALPSIQERTLEIVIKVEGIVRRGAITPDERLYLANIAAFLKQTDMDRFVNDAKTAVNEDKNFYEASASLQTNMLPASEKLAKQTEQLLAILNQMVASNTTPKVDEFLRAAEGTFNESFAFWNVVAKELDVLIEIRIGSQSASRNQSVLWGMVALLLAAVSSTLLGIGIRSGVVNSVSEVVRQMRGIADVVNLSNRKLVDTSSTLASGTGEQASAIQQTVATLEQISSMTAKSAAGAQSSAEEARGSQSAATDSKASLQGLVRALSEINSSSTTMIDQVTDSNNRIVEFVSMIQEIGSKTKVINDIVFQTKLLSFNASVEAARAGEHGKGFAVVAEEVGNLAQMSGNAAREIATLLDQSTSKVNNVMEQTKRNLADVVRSSRERLEAGMKVAAECEQALDVAVGKVDAVTHLMSEIASATKEQSQGVSEISKAMNQLDEANHQNTTAAEHTAALARDLEQQALSLQNSIGELESRIGMRVNKGSAAPLPQAAQVIPLVPAETEEPRFEEVDFEDPKQHQA